MCPSPGAALHSFRVLVQLPSQPCRPSIYKSLPVAACLLARCLLLADFSLCIFHLQPTFRCYPPAHLPTYPSAHLPTRRLPPSRRSSPRCSSLLFRHFHPSCHAVSHLPRKWLDTLRLLQRSRLCCMQEHGIADMPHLRRFRRYQCLALSFSLSWLSIPLLPTTSQPQTPAEYHRGEPGSLGEFLHADSLASLTTVLRAAPAQQTRRRSVLGLHTCWIAHTHLTKQPSTAPRSLYSTLFDTRLTTSFPVTAASACRAARIAPCNHVACR